MAQAPDFSLEESLFATGARLVCGVDEVGRGPLAGPVLAATVILDPAAIPVGLNDSKKLTKLKREALAQLIHQQALAIGIAELPPEEIDRVNIYQATFLAMRQAVANLSLVPDHILIDGNKIPPELPAPATAVVKGDGKSVSIAAASIVAKVARDQIMAELAITYPGYGWERNSGYPTKQHREALQQLGVTPVHRRSFRPVREALGGLE